MGELAKFVDVPKLIREDEKELVHLLIVEGRFNPATLSTTYSQRVQVYNPKSWLTVKDRLKQIGVNHAFVIHSPEEDNRAKANEYRKSLIEKVKALGYEGPLNVANSVFEEYLEEKAEA